MEAILYFLGPYVDNNEEGKMPMNQKKQLRWLNATKFMAIFAVMMDHTNGLLYSSQAVANLSYYSVSLFILISGMTSYLSNLHHEESIISNYWRSTKRIILSYSIAVCVYLVWMTHGYDFLAYLNYLVHFNISAPHYFVLLYLQLMMVNRFLYNLLQHCEKNWKGYITEAGIMGIIMIFSIWTTNCTNILNVYGGGGRLFGGTYLILYYLGMLSMRHGWFENTSWIKNSICLLAGAVGYYSWWRTICIRGHEFFDSKVKYGGYNPPSLAFMGLAVFMLLICFGLFSVLERNRFSKWITISADWLGKHTMSIFLYHKLILDLVIPTYFSNMMVMDIWLKRILYFILMIFGSIMLDMVVQYVIMIIKWASRKPEKIGKE